MIIRKPTVTYLRTVSDIQLKLLLDAIAEVLGRDLRVHSGDRDFRPSGSPKHSLHLAHRAADVHVIGMPDSHAFQVLRQNRNRLPTNGIHRYQIIHHGPCSETEGEHLHIGDYHLIKSLIVGPGVTFFVEGLLPATKGKYAVVL